MDLVMRFNKKLASNKSVDELLKMIFSVMKYRNKKSSMLAITTFP